MNTERKPGPDAANDALASPGMASAIERRLLERVADADESHLTIAADSGDWKPFTPGLAVEVLHEQGGVLSYLLRLHPGACLLPHRHLIDEECIVIQGRLRVDTHTEIGPGDYHLAHRGALHPSIVALEGETVFVRGAVPEARDVLR